MIIKLSYIALITSLFLASLTPYQAKANSEDQADTLRRITSLAPENLKPFELNTQDGSDLIYDMYEGLITFDSQFNLIPGMAKSWKLNDEGCYHFTLKDNIKWSDGKPVTAVDFLNGFIKHIEYTQKKDLRMASGLEKIKNSKEYYEKKTTIENVGIHIINDKQIEYCHDLQSSSFLLEEFTTIHFFPFPSHSTEELLSNGAYYLDGKEPNHRLKKNKYYYGSDKVYFDYITYEVEKNPAQIRFIKGNIDLSFVYFDNKEDLQKYTPYGSIIKRESSDIQMLGVGKRHPVLLNEDVRYALNIGISRSTLSSRFGDDVVTPKYTAKIDESKEDVLKITGLTNEADAIKKAKEILGTYKYNKDNMLNLDLIYFDNKPNQRRVSILSALYKRINVKVRPIGLELDQIKLQHSKGKYDLVLFHQNCSLILPSSCYDLSDRKNFWNPDQWYNPELEALTRELALMREPEQAKIIRAATLFHKDSFFIPLFSFSDKFLINRDIGGYDDKSNNHILLYPSLWLSRWLYRK